MASQKSGSRTPLGSRARLVAWVGLFVATIALLVVAAVDDGGLETDAERVQRLAESYACPTCQGQSVADSNAAVAANIRQLLSQRVSDGSTDREIRDELIAAYNAEILLNPPAEGFVTLVWVLPVMLVVVGAAGVAFAVTRNQGGLRDPSSEDRDLVAQALDALDDRRTSVGDGDRAGAGDRVGDGDVE